MTILYSCNSISFAIKISLFIKYNRNSFYSIIEQNRLNSALYYTEYFSCVFIAATSDEVFSRLRFSISTFTVKSGKQSVMSVIIIDTGTNY